MRQPFFHGIQLPCHTTTELGFNEGPSFVFFSQSVRLCWRRRRLSRHSLAGPRIQDDVTAIEWRFTPRFNPLAGRPSTTFKCYRQNSLPTPTKISKRDLTFLIPVPICFVSTFQNEKGGKKRSAMRA